MTTPRSAPTRNRLAALEADNLLLREAVDTAAHLHTNDMQAMVALRASAAAASRRSGSTALAASRAQTHSGQADLLASEAALASSQAETKEGLADLLASEVALASSQAETKVGLADLLASAVALASSRAEAKVSLADLLASAVALASSRAETKAGQTDLLASEVENRSLSVANAVLLTNETALEHLVEKRTAALMREVEERRRAEEALRQGEKLRAIGQLTGGIAHDFNNILQLIFSGITLLRVPNLSAAQAGKLLKTIEHAAEQASELTRRLLAFARRQALQPRPIDLRLLLTEMSGLLKPTLGSGISMQTDFAADLWPVIADPNQLEVAVLNLAVNARDAMLPAGGVFSLRLRNARLEATAERAAGDYVCLAVQDTGRGMPAAVMAQVFEPFFTTKAPGEGTGLGLAQVYGFAKQSGGDVGITSTPGEGTVVLFHLPRPSADALAAAVASVPKAPATAHPLQTNAGLTVLVVDDNADLVNFTVSMLQSQGYATRHANSADEALALMEGGATVHAVLSDVVMPGTMDGVQLAAVLRQRYPAVAVVLATGYSQLLAERNGPAAAEVLSKPYRLNDLTSALNRAFSAVEMHAGC